MHLIKITILSASILMFAGCKKNDKPANNTEVDNCAVTKAASNGDIIPGQYIVVYKNSTEVRSASSGGIAQLGRDVLSVNQISSTAMKQSFNGAMGGFVAALSEPEAQRLQNDPAIEYVEPDRIIALSTCFTIVEPRLITWNINKVGYGDGTGKTAWILDTGIDFDHPDLNVDVNRSRSFLNGVNSADDEHGHGTHVAGIIGAKNNSIGVLGVASGANLVSLRVLNEEGVGTLSAIIQALNYVSANARAGDVVNMSIGEEEASDVLDLQVKNTAAKGILIAIAAGNDGEAANLYSPGRANAPNIFTVSATDSLDRFASFSNYGNDVVDYAAPGVRILSTYKDGKYAKMSGTSMAAPHVAGLLLLNGGHMQHSASAINDPDGTPDLIAHK
jgi:subtilisin family serine protease